MAEIHVIHVAFLRILIDALAEAGANVQRLLQQTDLKYFDLDDVDQFVPMAAAGHFFELVATHETGPSLPSEVYSRFTIDAMGGWSNYVHSAPDLLTATINGSKPEARTFSMEKMKLNISDRSAGLIDTIAWEPGLARDWRNSLGLALMVDGFRIYMGRDWSPTLIHSQPQAATGIEDYFNANTSYGSHASCFGVLFSADLLPKKAEMAVGLNRPDGFDSNIMPQTASARLESLLESWRANEPRTLERAAEVADMSPRGMQRSLELEGATFSNILDVWRFKTALNLLADDQMSIFEIAERLGYAQDVNFVRAFRRWMGVTPGRYRQTSDSQTSVAGM